MLVERAWGPVLVPAKDVDAVVLHPWTEQVLRARACRLGSRPAVDHCQQLMI
jgi:hypothetical protein